MKKGDISLTTIVVAAIALVVLIVLIAIFTGRISIFGKSYDKQTTDAQNRVCNVGGGACSSSTTCANSGSFSNIGGWIDCASNEGCCKPSTA